MRKKSRNFLCGVIFIFVAITLVSIKTTAQTTKATPTKNINNETSDKKPVLEAKLGNDNFQPSDDIELALKIKNETTLAISLFDVEPERSFGIVVRDAEGLIVPETKEGLKRMHPDTIMARETIIIEQGKEFKFRKIRLNDLFDLKRIGNYTIEVKRIYYVEDSSDKNVSLENKGGILTSTISFTVNN